jgi:acetyl-CoA C-acetyltransferase
MTNEVYILSAVRTPIGKFIPKHPGGKLSNISAPQLGGIVIKEAVERAMIKPEHVDEVIMGNVLSAGLGQNTSRQAAIYAGIPVEKTAYRVDQVCGSGLRAVISAAQAIKAGNIEIAVAGGMESMSNAPHAKNLRKGQGYGNVEFVDTMIHDGLWDVYNDFNMIATGDIIAKKYELTRKEIDEFAYRSHMLASDATKNGRFKKEIKPVEIKLESGESCLFEIDEGIRPDTTVEKLTKLNPVNEEGVTTAGNASQRSDGASALVLASQKKADYLGIKPLARIVDYSESGVDPALVMEAPIPAVNKLLEKCKLSVDNIGLYEHNEAFGSASVALYKTLKINLNRFNVNGGAIALGHPIGASGARILTTLIYAMEYRKDILGIATLCMGGGNGLAMLVERMY